MRTQRIETNEQRLQREAAEFTQRWDFERVLDCWRARLSDFGLVAHPIFLEVVVHDSGSPGDREPALSWWPVKGIDELRADINRHFERYPGTRGPVHAQMSIRQGEIDTLSHLWGVREDQSKCAAVLISASLFSRYESSRGRVMSHWPRHHCVELLRKWAYQRWQSPGSEWGWHYACTSVIPYESDDYIYPINSMDALVRYLAEEHAALLLQHRPVVIHYRAASRPTLRSV